MRTSLAYRAATSQIFS